MQIKGLHKNIYKLSSYALSQEKLDIYRKKYEKQVKHWDKLKSEDVSEKTCQEIIGISRATYYRYKTHLTGLAKGILPPSKRPKNLRKPQWGEAEKQLVLKLRRENPTYGKEKIAIILKRDFGQTLSESTVGRVLKFLSLKGLIVKSPSALRIKRKRVFKKHAKPWEFKNYKAMSLGERVQVDHMTVTKNGLTAKHFQAWDRKSKYILARVYSNATAKSAKRFLLDLVSHAPFPNSLPSS
jgi:transposase